MRQNTPVVAIVVRAALDVVFWVRVGCHVLQRLVHSHGINALLGEEFTDATEIAKKQRLRSRVTDVDGLAEIDKHCLEIGIDVFHRAAVIVHLRRRGYQNVELAQITVDETAVHI